MREVGGIPFGRGVERANDTLGAPSQGGGEAPQGPSTTLILEQRVSYKLAGGTPKVPPTAGEP